MAAGDFTGPKATKGTLEVRQTGGAVGTRIRSMMTTLMVTLVAAVTIACSGANREGKQDDPEVGHANAFGTKADPVAAAASSAEAEVLELGPVAKGSLREHPAKVAWTFEGAEPKEIDIGQAEARGYTVIDLSAEWTPYIFTTKTAGAQDEQANAYRKNFIGLANDRVDSDGDTLAPHQHNYLELYGIPPSLTVVKTEWDSVFATVQPCLEAAGFDPTVFTAFDGTIAYRTGKRNKRNRKAKAFRAQLKKQMRRADLDFSVAEDLEQAATHRKTRASYKKWKYFQGQVDVIDHAQRRFRCEKLFNNKAGVGEFKRAIYDSPTTHALANFERKHDLMGWGHFKRDNLAKLAIPPNQAAHDRLLRVLQERVVSSVGIVEDGSAGQWRSTFKWKDKAGAEHGLRDLATEFTDATAKALGLGSPETARARLEVLSKLGDGDFKNLLVAIKLPALPEYYSPDMRFETVINRGDVWYDFPYNDVGKRLSQPRRRYPHLTLYVNYADQRIPLVHWRTTIGSWRNETFEGELMLKYKNSDVGARVWKDIVAAPVWIPPAKTPAAELVKGKWKNGKFRRGVNYDEIGPGYRSAYGLVAAYHIRQSKDREGNVVSEFDNSIRTHGSVDYMSILRRFSHGCHRLYNMDAVRMFSFVLRHRDYERVGQVKVGVGRVLEVEERRYHLKINSRGYRYTLTEPIPVMVTEGRIRGRRRSPFKEYIARPLPPEEVEPVELIGDEAVFPANGDVGPPAPAAPAEPAPTE